MVANPWLELDDEIRAQLTLQVELSLDRHHAFMLAHGLGDCRRVVDIGTGSGLFLAGIAARHPEIEFRGIDDKPHMIAEAGNREMPNVAWQQADALDPAVQDAIAVADGILMRYFVLHMPNTAVAIPRLLSRARPGTRVWIVDLDTDRSCCDPPHPAFTAFAAVVQRFGDTNGVAIRTGSMLPPVLESAGFQVQEVVVEPFDSDHVAAAVLAEYLLREARLYHHFLTGTHESELLRRLAAFLAGPMARGEHFVRYGMAMVAAVRESPASHGLWSPAAHKSSGIRRHRG